jgi:hypothetical protein
VPDAAHGDVRRTYEVRNLIDGGEEVLVGAWQRGWGRTSGVEVSEWICSVFMVRGGGWLSSGCFEIETTPSNPPGREAALCMRAALPVGP